VVLPDYQEIGIGYGLLTFLARHFARLGYVLGLVTSAKNLVYKMRKSKDWEMFHYGIGLTGMDFKLKKVTDRKMASFRYVGPDAVRIRKHIPVRYKRKKAT